MKINTCRLRKPIPHYGAISFQRGLKMLLTVALFWVACLVCVSAENVPSCSQETGANGTVSKLLEDGNSAFEAGDYAVAETRWNEIRECASGTADWPKAVFNLALLKFKHREFDQAVTYFTEVLQSAPNDREPGGNIMETNRNYSYRSALGISQSYEEMGSYIMALRYAWLAKTKYRYYSWCGTCYQSAQFALNKRIAYLAIRTSRVHIWATVLVIGLFAQRTRRSRKRVDAGPTPEKA